MDRATQIKIVHILKKELSSTLGLEDETYRSMLNSMFGVNSSTLLNDIQLTALIAKLNILAQNDPNKASQQQLLYIEDLFQKSPIQNCQGWLRQVLGKAVKLSQLTKKEIIHVPRNVHERTTTKGP